MNESEYKELGEGLAESSVRTGLGARQLRSIYKLVKTKPLPMVEAFVKRQISRTGRGRRGGPRGFDVFGPALLEKVEEFKDNKQGLLKVLWYANMLYPYYEGGYGKEKSSSPGGQTGTGSSPTAVDGNLRSKLEPIVSKYCSRHGYSGLTLREERSGLLCTVRLRRFRGNPRSLSVDLVKEVTSYIPELTGRIRFWIDMKGGR